MSDEGRLVANRYRIVERLGTGAMGAVWQAQDEVLHRTVAIKQLLLQPGLDEDEAEDARQRTMREARIAARLHHPNAISVFDVLTDEQGQPCLIMEFLPSTSLAALLQEEQTLAPLEVARIGAQIASALRDAHDVGVVHRDIKPGNVLLAENGTVKLTDFGISHASDDVTVTKTGMIAGTPAYLAPEVATGGSPGPESDVFALGSTLYAATEGQPPFGLSENTLSLLHSVAGGQINPPQRSGPLASVLAVMLHPDIEHRPTAEESEDLLAAVARGETPLGGTSEAATALAAPPPEEGSAEATGYIGSSAELEEFDDIDEFEPHHSGTLSTELGTGFGTTIEEGPFEPAEGYPDQDYDWYPLEYSDVGHTEFAGRAGHQEYAGHNGTRAVPADLLGRDQIHRDADFDSYEDFEGYGEYEDFFDDEDYDRPDEDDEDPEPLAPLPDDEDDDERGNWKIPAVVGALTVAGLVALTVWIFGSTGRDDEAEQPVVADTSRTTETTSVTSTQRTTATTSSGTTTTTTTTAGNVGNPVNPGNGNTGGNGTGDGSTGGGNTGGGNDSNYTPPPTITTTTSPQQTEENPPPPQGDPPPGQPPSSSTEGTTTSITRTTSGSTSTTNTTTPPGGGGNTGT